MNEGFRQFWAAYPLKIGKLASWAVWKRLKPDAALEAQIIASVGEHIRTRAWRDGYIPHPRTFLHQGRYWDELQAADFAPLVGKQTSRLAKALKDLEEEGGIERRG